MNEKEIVKIINRLFKQEIPFDVSLKELGFNSLLYINLIVEIEDVFGIEFDEDYLTSGINKTLNDIMLKVEYELNQ